MYKIKHFFYFVIKLKRNLIETKKTAKRKIGRITFIIFCIKYHKTHKIIKYICKKAAYSRGGAITLTAGELVRVANVKYGLARKVIHALGPTQTIVTNKRSKYVFEKKRLLDVCNNGSLAELYNNVVKTQRRTDGRSFILVSFHLPAHWVEMLDELARERGVTRSDLVRAALGNLLKKYED